MRAGTVIGLLVLLSTTSCIPLWGGLVYASKPVMEKQGSNLLVATDRSTCTVSDSVFNSVQIGVGHRCIWNSSEKNATPIRPGTLPTPRRLPGIPPGGSTWQQGA